VIGMSDDDCWFCGDNRGEDTAPGGWLSEGGGWRVGHVPAGWGPAGTVVIESIEHAEDLAALDDDTARELTLLIGRTQRAIREATGADRAYVWATMDRWPHLHVWLVPWWADHALRGPRYLAEILTFDGAPAEADRAAALDAATAVRDRLAVPSPG
jgi:histidine triad (HIT) family protein